MPFNPKGKSDINPLRFGIFAVDRVGFRRIGWITTGPQGVSIGIARSIGPGTKYRYRPDGGLNQVTLLQTPQGAKETERFLGSHAPLSGVRGLEQFLSVQIGPEDRLRSLPFKRRYESVYVRSVEGRVTFKVGFLEPGLPQALDAIGRSRNNHFHLITASEPWIVLWNSSGFGTNPHKWDRTLLR